MPDRAPTFPSPDDLAPGPGYSHVVSMPPGRMVWTSGQVAIRPDGTVAGDEGLEAQTRLAFENVGRALRAGGATWADVVKLTMSPAEPSRGDGRHGRRDHPEPQHRGRGARQVEQRRRDHEGDAEDDGRDDEPVPGLHARSAQVASAGTSA